MRIAMVLSVTLAACSSVPADFAVDYHWRAGSMPPPSHTEFDITIAADGRGEITYRPDYPSRETPVWKIEFKVGTEAREKLYKQMKDEGIFSKVWKEQNDPPIGGSTRWLNAVAGGKKVKVPAFPTEKGNLKALYEVIQGLVSENIWSLLKARRKKYVEKHDEK